MRSFYSTLPVPVKRFDESQIVYTPIYLVDKQLDEFPKSIWSDKYRRWLIPVSKSGIYELEIYCRLMQGLRDDIPDFNERRTHIVKKMIWSFALTPACELLIRRNYLGKVWDSMANFDQLEGNISCPNFLDMKVNVKGDIMVGKDDSGNEKYVHFHNIIEGNPPFQKSDGGGGKGSSAKALYPDFVMKAMNLKPDYLSLVIPGKWMTGAGKGTEKFLESMLQCGKLTSIVYESDAKKWFPQIDLKGGAMYFLYDASKNGGITSVNGSGQELTKQTCILTDPIEIGIRDKLISKSAVFFHDVMLGSNPYGLRSNHKEWCIDSEQDTYVCYHREGNTPSISMVAKTIINTKNENSIDKYKVCLAKAANSGKDGTNNPFVINPEEIVSETYFVMSTHNDKDSAQNANNYLETHFAQYMISLLKPTQNMSKKVFKYLPYLDFSRSYSDQDLYSMFDLSEDEIKHIEMTTQTYPMFKVKSLPNHSTKKAA